METEITRRLGHTTVDAVLTVEKLAIQDAVLSAAQKTLDELGIGVRLTSVNIGSVTAPPDAVAAFRDVASAQADSARIVSEAESYANDLVPRARGEAQQMLESLPRIATPSWIRRVEMPPGFLPWPPNTPRPLT